MAEQFDGLGILWNTVSKEYNIGTYDEFSSKMQDREKRKAFYNTVGKRYNLGKTFIEFENKIKKKRRITFRRNAGSWWNSFIVIRF